MPTPAFLTVIGKVQGLITKNASSVESVSGASRTDHIDESMIQALSHEIISPYDRQSGSSTGPRIHGPLCLTKSFDSASPLLLQALVKGEELEKVEIRWYRMSGSKEEHYYTTTLEDAKIVAIKDYMPSCQDPGNSHFTHLQEVHFSYRDITWNHVAASTTGSDQWDKSKMD
ncbi:MULTISPECIES: Hcp family type VI secretion system effector [Pseudomonas syringae group]|uniref:Hcp family type VI secretion system effector n=3 Tax=Pseudomonas syringae group TaxID=136849 RepID=A0AA40P411_9PSED|nr:MULTISPECIES: Hcp family type VI secretion system effector [Pseudomonas syringae group]KOP52415.1 Major exported protein [Pseudomonas coronafaciens pv. porri]KOP60324.1 Major exported protein [Pseudomonas coronafaciens pv. porri]KPW36218.1 Secreted protein Hcp [Pseudomonas coronafaciens pv. atropurpurea]KPY09464.1 Secreted protein Hcp [Pseudomonas coronafaciens pv. oryzae]KPY23575.1 Secreted protein Hcp [Pseudomonas coronafaciens pv. porri]